MSDPAGGEATTVSGAVDDRARGPARPPAAAWQVRPAAGAWCSAQLAELLPWAAHVRYSDRAVHDSRVGREWHLVGITQRGRIHAHDGTHREDEMSIVSSTRGFALAAADGAGSSRWSRVAAWAVCREVSACARSLWEATTPSSAALAGDALVQALDQASRALRDAAQQGGLDVRDFRTTALVALVVDQALVTLQVGDGAIIGLTRAGTVRRLGVTDSGSYSGEVTAFIPEVTLDGIAARLTTHALDDFESLLVVTDGIEDPFYPLERRGVDVMRQLYEGVEAPLDATMLQHPHGPVVGADDALEQLTAWISFERRGENDDRTLAGAFRLPPRRLGAPVTSSGA